MNSKESLVEAYAKLLNEDAEVVKENFYDVSIEKVAEEAIKHLQSIMDVKLKYIKTNGDKITFQIDGDENVMSAVFDRLDIAVDDALVSKNGVDAIKKTIVEYLDSNLDSSYDLKLGSVQTFEYMVSVHFTLQLLTLEKEIRLGVKLYIDGNIEYRVDYFGDSFEDTLSVTEYDLDGVLSRIHQLLEHFNPAQITDN